MCLPGIKVSDSLAPVGRGPTENQEHKYKLNQETNNQFARLRLLSITKLATSHQRTLLEARPHPGRAESVPLRACRVPVIGRSKCAPFSFGQHRLARAATYQRKVMNRKSVPVALAVLFTHFFGALSPLYADLVPGWLRTIRSTGTRMMQAVTGLTGLFMEQPLIPTGSGIPTVLRVHWNRQLDSGRYRTLIFQCRVYIRCVGQI